MKEFPPINIGEPCPEIYTRPEDTRKRIVVTGGSGMLGSYLLAELIGQGYRRITIMLRSLGAIEKIREVWKAEGLPYDPACLDIVPFRPDDTSGIAETFTGADIVFNCAAAVTIGGTPREELIANNVDIARTVARAALDARSGLLVHVSSVAALLPGGGLRIDSDSMPGFKEGSSAYSESKYLSELEIAKASAEGLRTITVNPVTILGWGHKGEGSSAIIPVLAAGMPFFTGGITGWVDARDVARAMVMLTTCPDAPGRRFVLSCGNTSYKNLLAEGCRAAGRKPPRVFVPERAARAVSAAEHLWSRLSRRRRFLTPEMVSILYGKHYYDGEGIKKYVNFEYSPLGSTIDRLVKIYLREKL